MTDCVTGAASGFIAGFSVHLLFDVLMFVGVFALGRFTKRCFHSGKHRHPKGDR